MSGGYHPWSKFNAHGWSNLNARRQARARSSGRRGTTSGAAPGNGTTAANCNPPATPRPSPTAPCASPASGPTPKAACTTTSTATTIPSPASTSAPTPSASPADYVPMLMCMIPSSGWILGGWRRASNSNDGRQVTQLTNQCQTDEHRVGIPSAADTGKIGQKHQKIQVNSMPAIWRECNAEKLH